MTGRAATRRAAPLPAALLLAAAAVACGGEARSTSAGAEQEAAVVPSDPAVVTSRADAARVRGDSAAPVRVIEISDFECPYCAQFNRETFPSLDSAYIRTGRVEYIWIAYPNPGHRRSWPATEAAYCAGAVGKFWAMHDLLFERQEEWSGDPAPVERFVSYAERIGIEPESFRGCLREDRTASLQVRDAISVVRVGIGGTPFFIIADSIPAEGALSFDRFRSILDSVLAAG